MAGPWVADPELLDVGDVPAARGEPAHLLLGFGVVEAEGKVRVEEEVAPHSTGDAVRWSMRWSAAPTPRIVQASIEVFGSTKVTSKRFETSRAIPAPMKPQPEAANARVGRASEGQDHAARREDEKEERRDPDQPLLGERVQVEVVRRLGRGQAAPGQEAPPRLLEVDVGDVEAVQPDAEHRVLLEHRERRVPEVEPRRDLRPVEAADVGDAVVPRSGREQDDEHGGGRDGRPGPLAPREDEDQRHEGDEDAARVGEDGGGQGEERQQHAPGLGDPALEHAVEADAERDEEDDEAGELVRVREERRHAVLDGAGRADEPDAGELPGRVLPERVGAHDQADEQEGAEDRLQLLPVVQEERDQEVDEHRAGEEEELRGRGRLGLRERDGGERRAHEGHGADEDRRGDELLAGDDRADGLDGDEHHRPGHQRDPEPCFPRLRDRRVLGERRQDDQEREAVLEAPEPERDRNEAGRRDRKDGRVVQAVGAERVDGAREGGRRGGARDECSGYRPLGKGRPCRTSDHGYEGGGAVVSGSSALPSPGTASP